LWREAASSHSSFEAVELPLGWINPQEHLSPPNGGHTRIPFDRKRRWCTTKGLDDPEQFLEIVDEITHL
jgi:hypothetical protein